MKEKAPIGLKPKYIHDRGRAEEIQAAMDRFNKAGIEIPPKWTEEYLAFDFSRVGLVMPKWTYRWNAKANPFAHVYLFEKHDITRQTIKWWRYPLLWFTPMLTQIYGKHLFHYKQGFGQVYLFEVVEHGGGTPTWREPSTTTASGLG